MKNTAIIGISLLLMILFTAGNAIAETTDSNTLSIQAQNIQTQLSQLREEIQKIQFNGLTIRRVSDQLTLANQAFAQESAQEKALIPTSYSQTLSKISEAEKIIQLALQTKTSLDTLKTQLKDAKTQNPNADFTETNATYQKAVTEFKNERYELSQAQIQTAYSQLTQATTLQAKTSAMYSETAKTIKNYLETNWQAILAILAAIAVIYLIAGKAIKKARLKNKIKTTQQELQIVQELTKTSQKEYFQKNTIPKAIYDSRIKTYTEKMHDLHTKIATLNEQLATTSNKNKKKQ